MVTGVWHATDTVDYPTENTKNWESEVIENILSSTFWLKILIKLLLKLRRKWPILSKEPCFQTSLSFKKRFLF